MRILYLHPNAWIGEYAMVRKLRALGHELFVLEEKRGLEQGKRHRSDYFQEPGDGIPTLWYDPRRGWKRLVTWIPDRVFRRAFDDRNLVHRMWVIPEAVRRFSPDAIVCSDGFTYGIPAAFLKRLGMLKARLVISYIGGDIMDAPEAEYGKRRTIPLVDWLIRSSFRGADVLRPVSPVLARLLERDGAPPERIHICPSHVVAPEATLAGIRERRVPVRAEIRRRYGIAEDAPLVVTLSGNQKGKGMHVLGEAWPAIVAACPGARWLLCGQNNPWLDAAVWPLLERHGLRDTVVASGRIEAPSTFEHLAAAEINVNPTLHEGLNMVVAEAAAVGTPTITSDGAGIAHWIERFAAGAVVPSGESGPLAMAVIQALGDRETLGRWASASLTMAREFSLERISSELSKLIEGPLRT